MEPFIQNQWLWMIILVPMSLILSFYIYARTKLSNKWIKPILIALRTASLVLIILLLLNPQVRQKSVSLAYPELSILLDQSKSIADSTAMAEFINQWQKDQDLNGKFKVNWYGFGQEIRPLQELNFRETQTNIGGAVRNLDRILGQSRGPMLVVTDGQQTMGPAFNYYRSNSRLIYPVILGDTIWPEDISIQRVTANPAVRKGQSFEVELLINRFGSSNQIKTQLEAFQNGIKVKTINVNFPIGATRQLIKTELLTNGTGNQTFKWILNAVPGEQIIQNNSASLNVESVEDQRRILLVHTNSHPDVGALTRGLLADDHTEVIPVSPEKGLTYLDQVDAVILYQPTKDFSELITRMAKTPINTWLIAGPQTQWSEITKIQPNLKKDGIGVSDALFVRPNSAFSLFKSPWDQWNDMPPLLSDIGQLSIDIPHQVLLRPVIQNQPLNSVQLGFFEENGVRWVVWDGVDLWRWRMEAFRLSKTHDSFDSFLGIMAKYVSKYQEKSALKLKYKAIYTQMAEAELYAQYLDKTDSLDMSAELEIRMINQQSNQIITRPLLAETKQYKLNLTDVPAGVYDFTLSVLGTNEQKSGQFEIAPVANEIGQGFAKIQPMKEWAELNQVSLRHLGQMDEFKEYLKNQKEFLPREVVTFKNLDFIRWYYALALLILMSATEWFIRKYNGLI